MTSANFLSSFLARLDRQHTFKTIFCAQIHLKMHALAHCRIVASTRASAPAVAKRPHQMWAPVVTVGIAMHLALAAPSLAGTSETFVNRCAGCHLNGGNTLGGPTLFPEDLKKNGVDTAELIYNLTYSGKGKMPGFGAECAPKGKCTFAARLSDDEIRDLSAYVLERAEAGWKQ